MKKYLLKLNHPKTKLYIGVGAFFLLGFILARVVAHAYSSASPTVIPGSHISGEIPKTQDSLLAQLTYLKSMTLGTPLVVAPLEVPAPSLEDCTNFKRYDCTFEVKPNTPARRPKSPFCFNWQPGLNQNEKKDCVEVRFAAIETVEQNPSETDIGEPAELVLHNPFICETFYSGGPIEARGATIEDALQRSLNNCLILGSTKARIEIRALKP